MKFSNRIGSRRNVALFAIVALSGLVGSPSVVAQAAEPPSELAELSATLTEFWEENGVGSATIETLAAGVLQGNLPDAITLDVPPITSANVVIDGESRTTETFPDGSITVSSVGPSNDSNARGISGCVISTWTGVTYRTDCLVSGGNGAVSIYFHAAYTIQHQGVDSIPNGGAQAGITCSPGSCSAPTRSHYVPTESTAGGAAQLSYSTNYNLAGVATATYRLTLTVGNNAASSSF